MGLRQRHSGSRSSRRHSINSGHKRGSTTSIRGTSSLKLRRPAISPVVTARVSDGKQTWILDFSERSWGSLLDTVQGHFRSICLGNLSYIHGCEMQLPSLKNPIIDIPFCSRPMAPCSTDAMWTGLHPTERLTKSSGHGDPKPPSHKKRRRS